MIIIENTLEKRYMEIKKIEASSLYRINNNLDYYDPKTKESKKAFLDVGKAVINESIFSEWVRKHGITVTKRNETNDFISMSFDYGVLTADKSISSDELREYYYVNGARVPHKYDKDGKRQDDDEDDESKYKMLMRSTGKAKDGKCIFVKDSVIRRIIRSCYRLIKWSRFDTVSFVPASFLELLLQNKLRHTRTVYGAVS